MDNGLSVTATSDTRSSSRTGKGKGMRPSFRGEPSKEGGMQQGVSVEGGQEGAERVTTDRPPPKGSVALTEREFQRQVIDLARILGYVFIYHAQLSKWSEKGWPDLVLVRVMRGRERIVYAELKSEKGKLTDRQVIVLNYLRQAGADVHVWRPSDFDTIAQVLA